MFSRSWRSPAPKSIHNHSTWLGSIKMAKITTIAINNLVTRTLESIWHPCFTLYATRELSRRIRFPFLKRSLLVSQLNWELLETFREITDDFRELTVTLHEFAEASRELIETCREFSDVCKLSETFRELSETSRELAETPWGFTDTSRDLREDVFSSLTRIELALLVTLYSFIKARAYTVVMKKRGKAYCVINKTSVYTCLYQSLGHCSMHMLSSSLRKTT